MNNKYDLNKFVFDFAAKYMPNYKQDGDNLRAQFCPLCNGNGKDKNTFGINKFTSEYGCFRGGCKQGENTGNYKKLAERFGINMDYYLIDSKYKKSFQKIKKKIYKQPKNKVNEINNNLIEFFKKRGISKQTLELAKVKEINNSVVFDYYDIENKIVNRKYRKIDKKEFMAEKDGKPIFYNMQNIDLNYPLTIVEGEADVLACIESGYFNAVSIPNGVNGLDCIELCWDWLEHFKKIIIFVDLDESAEECREKLIERLGDWRCYVVNRQCECCKDANDILLKHGKEKVIEAIETAKEIPNEQLITIDQIKKINYDDIKRIKTGFIELDKLIGGFECGFLNILTGESGSGKSTLLNQFILEAIQNKMKVMCYSAELKAHKFLRWLTLSAAVNKNNLVSKQSRITNELFYEVKYSAYKKIFDWLLPNFYFLETKTIDEITDSQILKHMSYAFKKHNCEFFILDNLMTIDLEIIRETEILTKQKKFISKLKNFAATNNVIIILVAHPKKINFKQKKVTKDDISGTGNIFNIADCVLSLYRPQLNKDADEEFDNSIDVLKSREVGKYGTISFNFDENTKRFIEQSGIQSAYHYDWMSSEEEKQIENLKNEKNLEEIPF